MSNSFSGIIRLGKDPVLKNINGQSMLAFSGANNCGFGDKKTTIWLSCTIWGKMAESLEKHLKKGRQVWVCGELGQSEYTDKEGAKRTTLDLRVKDLDFVGGDKHTEQDVDPPKQKIEAIVDNEPAPF